jgi:hypothetical protein
LLMPRFPKVSTNSILKRLLALVTQSRRQQHFFERVRKSSNQKFLLYFADAVERVASAASNEPIAHTTRKSIAFKKIAKQLKVDPKEIIKISKLGRKYLTCMEVGGAAFLYLLTCSEAE